MHRKYECIVVVVVAWLSLISALSGCSGSAFRDSKDEVFLKNYNLLTLVAEYLVGLEHERVYITSSSLDGEISVNGKTYYIYNDDAVNAIELLKESGCSVILKADGVVTFVYWSTSDVGEGFAYSSDGSEPQLQFRTYLEKLSTENWFYYEENFNLWRLENQIKE